jgi:hypothetical protein
MLQGVLAPKVGLVSAPVLSARPQFSFGQSGLTFVPPKPYEPSKTPERNDLGDLAKMLRQQQKDEQERRQQEQRDAQLKLAERRQDEAERHNRMMERIKETTGGIGTGLETDEGRALEALQPIPNFRGGGIGLENVPEVAAKKTSEEKAKSTKEEISIPSPFESKGLSISNIEKPPKEKLDISLRPENKQPISLESAGPLLAPLSLNREVPTLEEIETQEFVSPEEVGTPEPETETETVAAKESAAPLSQLTVGDLLKRAELLGVGKPDNTPKEGHSMALPSRSAALSQEKKETKAAVQDVNASQNRMPESEEIKHQAPLRTKAEDEALMFKDGQNAVLPSITLKPKELPFNIFSTSETARKYASAVMRGTEEWRAEAPTPIKDGRGHTIGYRVEWKDNSDAIQKRLDKVAADLEKQKNISHAQAVQESKLLLQTGRAVNSSDDVRNYTRSNGFRSALVRFIPAYETASNPNAKNRGLSDLDLIDTYARAMSGGKVTEAQVHLIQKARNLKDKARVIFEEKLGAGDLLSQSQRDTMLRNMLESHNGDASTANQKMKAAREQLLKKGITDEAFLPQLFVDNIKLKEDVEEEQRHRRATIAELRLEAEKVHQNKLMSGQDKARELKQIQEAMKEMMEVIQHEDDLLRKQKYSFSKILNKKEFMSGKGGFLAGDKMVTEIE